MSTLLSITIYLCILRWWLSPYDWVTFFCEATQLSVLLLLHLIGTADVVGSHTKQLCHDGPIHQRTCCYPGTIFKVLSVCFSSIRSFIRVQTLSTQTKTAGTAERNTKRFYWKWLIGWNCARTFVDLIKNSTGAPYISKWSGR